MNLVLLTVLAAAALGGETVSAFRSREWRPRLFHPSTHALTRIQAGDPGVVRSRLVTIDLVALHATRPTDTNTNDRPALLLNVFDDLAYHAEVDRVDAVESGFTWVGHVSGYDLSTVTLACVNGVVAGSIVTPEAVFAIRYAGDGVYEIAQIDQASLPAELAPIPAEPGTSAAAGSQESSTLLAGASLAAGAAGNAAAPGTKTIVNTGVGVGAVVGAMSERLSTTEIRGKRKGADSQMVWPDAEPNRVVEIGPAARVDAKLPPADSGGGAVRTIADPAPRTVPLGSSRDGEPGRPAQQPPPGVLDGFNPGVGRRDDTVVRARVVEGPPMRTVVDVPVGGTEVSSPFVLSGWSVDLTSAFGSGIDAVHVWAFPADPDAPTAGQDHARPDPGGAAIFLGVAAPGPPRPDVVRLYGPTFTDASFRLDIDNLASGTYDLVVYPHRASTKQFEGARVVRIAVR